MLKSFHVPNADYSLCNLPAGFRRNKHYRLSYFHASSARFQWQSLHTHMRLNHDIKWISIVLRYAGRHIWVTVSLDLGNGLSFSAGGPKLQMGQQPLTKTKRISKTKRL